MPKSDTWPGGVAIESVSGMDSAGSCDSMLSANSGFSADSLDHLSAEERACLMFLEETIESLEVEEDSGLSNDETDGPSNGLKGKIAHRASSYQNNNEEPSGHEDPNKVIGRDSKPSQNCRVPTPLLIASGNAKMLSKPMEPSRIETPVAFIDAPDGFRSSPDHRQPGRTFSVKAALEGATAKQRKRLSSDGVDLPPSFIPEPPVRTSSPSDSKAKNDIHKSLDVKSQPKQQNVSSEAPPEFIPPPSDFMDEPMEKMRLSCSPLPPPAYEEPPEWIPELPKIEPNVSAGSIKPAEVTKSSSGDPEMSRGPLHHKENPHKNFSTKKASHLTPITIAHHSVMDRPMTPSPSSEHVPEVPKEYSDLKSPPTVAPKPKKLPSNIIFKSHKETGSTHSLLVQSERTQMDPQKVRMEALKKLGLLKNEDVQTGPGISPCQSPKFKAKARPQSPCSPTPPVEPMQELSRVSENPVPGDLQLRADSLKHQEAKSRGGSLKRQPTRSYEFKTASLDHTGTRAVVDPAPPMKSPHRTHVELSPGQLRKTRPPSVESAKEFSFDHQADDSTKSLHAAAVQPGNDAQKLPRSNGISVMISPHGKNGENRRDALKKLGLLRD